MNKKKFMLSQIYKSVFVLLAVLTVGLNVSARSYTVDEVPNVQAANHTRYVSDPDNVLSAATRTHIDSLLSDIRRQTTAEVAIVVIGKMAPEGKTDIDTYATALFEKWGLGDKGKDNGVLLLVSVDDRKFVLRPGYGAEEVLPDIICRDITENELVPALKDGDYDKGFTRVAEKIHSTMTDEKYRETLKADLESRKSDAWNDLLMFIFMWAVVVTLIMSLALILKVRSVSGKTSYEKYIALAPLRTLFLAACFFGAGLPVIDYLLLRYILNNWRNGEHDCPNCHAKMHKLDEESDNKYLTPSQDAEEKFNSVDYDVWLCTECGETDVYPFVNKQSAFSECPHCHARTQRQLQDRIVMQPTTSREGRGLREYSCMNCGYRHSVPYTIAKLATPGIVILPGGFGGGSGGGISGGGFGGGSTGGGGYSGGW